MMNWFRVEIEFNFFGKVSEVVEATDKDTAEIIAVNKLLKQLNCSKDYILNIYSKKITN